LAFTVVATVDATVSAPDDILDDFVSPAGDYMPLVEACGFTAIEHSDITDAFLAIMRRWLEAAADLEDGLRSALGDDVFNDKLKSRKESLEATEAGDLLRLLFTATA
jgi:hypothetical protein